MRNFSIFFVLAATPVAAHEAAVPHAHTDWAIPLGIGAVLLAAITYRAKVRK